MYPVESLRPFSTQGSLHLGRYPPTGDCPALPLHWYWIALAALVLLVFAQQVSLFQIRSNARKRDELFRIVTENAADMIALVDVKGRRLYNSPAYKRILGYSPAELGETSSFEQIHPDDRFKVLEAAREARETGTGKRLEYRVKHKNGGWRVLESLASTIRNDKGEVARLVIVNRDITERKQAEQKLEHNLFHDSLTNLPNRRLFLERLQNCFIAAHRDPHRQYALLLINLDRFKLFNDALGAGEGDKLLIEVASRLKASLRSNDSISRGETAGSLADPMLARLAGDEFTVLLDGVGDASDALRVSRRVQEAVALPAAGPSGEIRMSISVGISLSAISHERPEDILKEADSALRRAKSLGGSRAEVFDEAMHTRAEGRLRLEADLRTALSGQQFRVYYQPVVQLETRQVASFEALLRWEHPTQGLISPYRFLDAAEDTGILVSIGQWLMQQACRQLREWDTANATSPPVSVTVNVSERQFADARLANDIQEALRDTGVDPSRLQLEMTENVAAADPKLTVSVLSHLKHMGIGVILDDFGIGASSLRGLWQFPIDALKVDRALVREMQTDRAACDVVEVIVTLAHKMNLRVIAEGIETSRQLDRLRELGCQFGQGYYFSQPLQSKAALQFLSDSCAKAAGKGGSA